MDTKEAELILSGKYNIEYINDLGCGSDPIIVLRHKKTHNKKCIFIDRNDIKYMVLLLAINDYYKNLGVDEENTTPE